MLDTESLNETVAMVVKWCLGWFSERDNFYQPCSKQLKIRQGCPIIAPDCLSILLSVNFPCGGVGLFLPVACSERHTHTKRITFNLILPYVQSNQK